MEYSRPHRNVGRLSEPCLTSDIVVALAHSGVLRDQTNLRAPHRILEADVMTSGLLGEQTGFVAPHSILDAYVTPLGVPPK
jgi:hypothetical protein